MWACEYLTIQQVGFVSEFHLYFPDSPDFPDSSVEKLKTLIIYLIKVIHSLTFKRVTRNNIFYFYFDLLCTVKGIKLMCHSSHIDVIYTSKMPLYELSAPILPLWPWLKLWEISRTSCRNVPGQWTSFRDVLTS